MKAKFFLFLFLMLYASKGFSQAENNNWYFGDKAGVTFNTMPPSALVNNPIDIFAYGGLGTVSDKVTGTFLFHTNGKNVWDKNFTIMSNTSATAGNLNGGDFAEGSLIVPSITNNNQYYVFTLGQGTGKLFYSVVDLSITTTGSFGDVIAAQKNINLKRPDNSQFTVNTYASTVTTNNTGDAYWILFPNYNALNQSVLYAYKVDSNGVNMVPVISNLNFTISPTNSTFFLTCIKVSPDKQKLAISYTRANGQVGCQTKIYHFNSTSGTVDNSIDVTVNDKNIRDMEFSPNSNLVFLNNSYAGLSVIVYDFNNITMPRTIDLPLNPQFSQFQRAVTGDIYFSNNPSPNNRFLNKFHNPNDFNTVIDYNNVSLMPDSVTRTAYSLFPQSIPKLDCALFEDLRGNNASTTLNYSYQVSDRIITSTNYTVNNGQTINLYATNTIIFQSNTILRSGSTVLAKIQPCPSSGARMAGENAIKNVEVFDTKSELLITPNPATNFVSIKTSENYFNKVTIISLDGKLIKSKPIEKTNEYSLDISDISRGIYLVSVTSKEGNVITRKLVKN